MKAVKLTRLKGYKFTRLWITGVVLLGIVVSVLLNVKHAPVAGGWVAVMASGFSPLAVFLCIEMSTHVPILNKLGAGGRLLLTFVVCGAAAWISYESQAEYVTSLGFKGRIAVLLPVVIDGLMGVATVSLIEVSRHIRQLQEELAQMDEAEAVAAASVATPATAPVPPTPGRGKRGRRPGPQAPASKARALPRTTLGPGPKESTPVAVLSAEITDAVTPATDAALATA